MSRTMSLIPHKKNVPNTVTVLGTLSLIPNSVLQKPVEDLKEEAVNVHKIFFTLYSNF